MRINRKHETDQRSNHGDDNEHFDKRKSVNAAAEPCDRAYRIVGFHGASVALTFRKWMPGGACTFSRRITPMLAMWLSVASSMIGANGATATRSPPCVERAIVCHCC